MSVTSTTTIIYHSRRRRITTTTTSKSMKKRMSWWWMTNINTYTKASTNTNTNCNLKYTIFCVWVCHCLFIPMYRDWRMHSICDSPLIVSFSTEGVLGKLGNINLIYDDVRETTAGRIIGTGGTGGCTIKIAAVVFDREGVECFLWSRVVIPLCVRCVVIWHHQTRLQSKCGWLLGQSDIGPILLFVICWSPSPSPSPSPSSVDIISRYPLNLFRGGWSIQIKCHSSKNQNQPYHCCYNSRNKLNGTRGWVFFLLFLFFLMMLLLLGILPYDFYCCYWGWWWRNIRKSFCFLSHVFATTIAAAAAVVVVVSSLT